MLTNEILEEIYQYREAHAESFNYDIAAMFADWRKRQAESGKHSVTPPLTQVVPSQTASLKPQ